MDNARVLCREDKSASVDELSAAGRPFIGEFQTNEGNKMSNLKHSAEREAAAARLQEREHVRLATDNYGESVEESAVSHQFRSDVDPNSREIFWCEHDRVVGSRFGWRHAQGSLGDLAARYFARHREQERKDGLCFLPGKMLGNERKAQAVEHVDLMVFDIDTATTEEADRVLERLKQSGLAYIAHTSFNHAVKETEVSADSFRGTCADWGIAPEDQTAAQRYLLEKKHYPLTVVESAHVAVPLRPTNLGMVTVLGHDPMVKIRLALILDRPYVIAEMMERGFTEAHARGVVYDFVRNRVAAEFGIPHDASTKDVSRVFYAASCPPGMKDESWLVAHTDGKCIKLEALLPSRKELDAVDPKERGSTSTGQSRSADKRKPLVFQGIDLVAWAVQYGGTFELETALRSHPDNEDMFGAPRSDKPGVHVMCPFADDHTQPGGSGTFIVNASENEGYGFSVYCSHNSCQSKRGSGGGVDRLIYLQRWCEDGRLTVDDLQNPKFGGGPASSVTSGGTNKRVPIVNWTRQSSFGDLVDTTIKIVSNANDLNPRLFINGEGVVRIAPSSTQAGLRLQRVTTPMMADEIDRVSDWIRKSDTGVRHYSVPRQVAETIVGRTDLPLPPLTGVTDVPYFDTTGALVTERGYNSGSRMYYEPMPGFDLPQVANQPGDDEIQRARDWLLEALHDFPFDDGDDAGGRASRANFIGKLVQAFARPMIVGPCPGYLTQKPKAGTGASLLTDVFSIIAFGGTASVETEKSDPAEYQKTIVAHLRDGSPHIVFANLHNRLDNPTIAALLTSTSYQGRLLGRTEMVRASWFGVLDVDGNNVQLSDEIRRRMVFIRLDAKLENPDKRDVSGFKHPRLIEWVSLHRAELVWAVLTLIRAWIARGRPAYAGQPLASFEGYCDVVGGVLACAGIPGFLDNRGLLKESVGSEDDNFKTFVEKWWSSFQGAEVIIGALEFGAHRIDYEGENSPKRIDTLVDLLLAHSSEINLGFNSWKPPGWQQGMGKAIAAKKDQVFELATGEKVMVRRNQPKGKGMRQWLQRL